MTDEVDYIGVMIYYEKSGFHVTPEQITDKKILVTKLTGQALVADVWSDTVAAANAISSNNQQLETGHKYAIAWVYAYGATSIAIRFRHGDFQGNKPGGMTGTTVYHKKNFLDFRLRNCLPVFSASSPLIPEMFDSATATPVIVIGLIDVTDLSLTPGIEDFQLAKGTTTNGTATFTLLTVCAEGSLYIKDVAAHGPAHLRGYFLTGTKPLRGQIRSTDKAFQPNPIEIPPHMTLAGDFQNEILHPMPELKENSLIACYATS